MLTHLLAGFSWALAHELYTSNPTHDNLGGLSGSHDNTSNLPAVGRICQVLGLAEKLLAYLFLFW